MINAVSQICLSPYSKTRLKNVSFKENSAENSIETDIFQKDTETSKNEKKLSDQQKKFLIDYFAGTVLISALIGAFVYLYRNKGKNHTDDFMNIENYKFESLKDNIKVPVLDTCKSINKDLKRILQHQLRLANADKKVLEEAGSPYVANRFLLSGPPGVGKTYFSKIYAKALDADYMEILFSDLNSRWVGESEEKMDLLFKNIINTAKKNPNKKYVVTFNEIDSLVLPVEQLTGGSGSTHFASLRRQRSIFLTYIDKLQNEVPNVTVIGTTNMSPQNKNLDGAAMSRFQNVTEIPYPDGDCLYEAIKIRLENVKGKDKFISENDDKLKNLAKIMAERKFSFRNLEYIINEAKSSYLDEKIYNENAGFKYEYLENAQKRLQKSDGEREAVNAFNEIQSGC